MPFSQKIPFDDPPADELASQSTQHPQILCVWTAYVPQSGSSPSPLPRRAHTLTETANAAGDLFLFGGLRNDDSCVSGNVYVFSSRGVSTTLLQTSGEASVPRFAHGAALFGTTLLVCGGVSHKSVLRLDLLHLLNLGTSDPFMSSLTPADHGFALQKRESGPASLSMVLGRAIVITIPQRWSVPSSSFLVVLLVAGEPPMICGRSI